MLIEARKITKSYGSLEAAVLKGIDLAISEGERVAVTGASGSGKSTLLHLLASLDPPTTGEVLFRGEDLYRRGEEAISLLRNREIGFVFQFHHLLPELSTLENVILPLLIRGLPRTEVVSRGRECLEALQLQGKEGRRPGELSGGEQQRVAVARALISRPSILFADEPTGNLDRENGERLLDLLFRVQERRPMALVFVTHNESLTSRFSKKYRLADGFLRPAGRAPS